MSKIDINKQYRTRDGREVKLFTTESPDPDYPVVGAVDEGKAVGWGNQTWSETGIFLKPEWGESDVSDGCYDLIEVEEVSP